MSCGSGTRGCFAVARWDGVRQRRRRLQDGGVGESCVEMPQLCDWMDCILLLCVVRLPIGNLVLQIWALIGAIKSIFGRTHLDRCHTSWAARDMHVYTLLLSIETHASRVYTIATKAIATEAIATEAIATVAIAMLK